MARRRGDTADIAAVTVRPRRAGQGVPDAPAPGSYRSNHEFDHRVWWRHRGAVGGDDARRRRARGDRARSRPGPASRHAGAGVGVMAAQGGDPVPPATRPTGPVPTRLRTRATGADPTAAGRRLHLGELPAPAAADGERPVPAP